MLSKVSVDEVFMHYFEKMLSASAGFSPHAHQGSAPGPGTLGEFHPSDPLTARTGKNPASAHVKRIGPLQRLTADSLTVSWRSGQVLPEVASRQSERQTNVSNTAHRRIDSRVYWAQTKGPKGPRPFLIM